MIEDSSRIALAESMQNNGNAEEKGKKMSGERHETDKVSTRFAI